MQGSPGVTGATGPQGAGTVLSITSSIKTATYSANFGELVLYNPTGATFSILLPIPSGNVNSEVGVKNVSDSINTITVSGTGAAQIDGVSTDLLSSPRLARTYKSTGTGFIIT